MKENVVFENPENKLIESIRKIDGIISINKINLDGEYFVWAKNNLEERLYQQIKENYNKVNAYECEYKSGEYTITGFVWYPKNIMENLPLVVFNRGGSGNIGSIDSSYKGTLYSHLGSEISKNGNIVIASNYRGGINSQGKDEWGGSDLQDVVNLKKISEDFPNLKSKNSVVVGVSRGGMMSYMLAKNEPWVNAVVSLSGVTDLVQSGKDRPEMQEIYNESFGGSQSEMENRSVNNFYNEIPKYLPLLVMHGTDDDRVNIEQVRRFKDLMLDSGHSIDYHEYEGSGHYLTSLYKDPDNKNLDTNIVREEILKKINDFIKENSTT